MSTAAKSGRQARTRGAVKAGDGDYIFPLAQMAGIEAGTGSNPHHHPNEQWNYIVKGKLRVKVGDQPERICGPGTLLYFPANVVHYTIATEDEDVVFFAVKDMTHGIIGIPVDAKQGAYTGAKK